MYYATSTEEKVCLVGNKLHGLKILTQWITKGKSPLQWRPGGHHLNKIMTVYAS